MLPPQTNRRDRRQNSGEVGVRPVELGGLIFPRGLGASSPSDHETRHPFASLYRYRVVLCLPADKYNIRSVQPTWFVAQAIEFHDFVSDLHQSTRHLGARGSIL